MPGVLILLSFVGKTAGFWYEKRTLMQDSSNLTKPPEGEDVAYAYGDIGVTKFATDARNQLSGWSFLLPLENFRDPANAQHLEDVPPAFRLGSFSDSFLIKKILSASDVERSTWKLGMGCFTD